MFGALAVYVLVGLTFGFVIGAIATGSSTDYFASGTDASQSTRVYFSFTTLTTTGYGDYTAATRGGRALAVLEMLLGQLYLVTVISLLVANLRRAGGDLRLVAIGVVAQLDEPAPQHAVQRLGADDLLRRDTAARAGRGRTGSDWLPPIPPCEPTSSSNAATSSVSGRVGGVDQHVGAVREAVGAAHVARRRWGRTARAGPRPRRGSSSR